MKAWQILFFGILLSISLPSFAQEQFKIPPLTDPVMDLAGVIDTETKAILQRLIRQSEQNGAVQATVLTVPSLMGEPIEQVSIKVADQWKLGGKGKDNGVLILIAPSERRSRIEVGQGLEGDLPDVVSKRILADIGRAYFKAGQFSQGILAVTVQVLEATDPKFTADGNLLKMAHPLHSQREDLPWWAQILIFMFIGFLMLRGRFFAAGYLLGGMGGGRGGGSSGGWSGGGGGFSGGGSSDSW